MSDPNRPNHDDLVRQIEADPAQAPVLIAGILFNLILPALGELKEEQETKWNAVKHRLWQSEMVAAEISAIYEHLQDMVPQNKRSRISEQKNRFQGRLERMTKHFGLEEYQKQQKREQGAERRRQQARQLEEQTKRGE